MNMPASDSKCIPRRWLAAAGLLGLLAGTVADADMEHEFLFFPTVYGFNTFSESDAAVEDSFTRAGLDMLYGASGDRFRFLGEFLWSSDEAEFERLQAGLRMSGNTFAWAGRFHAPAKFWNSEYHHGQFLQTSITRPALEEWEDDSGSQPAHVTGLLLETEQQRDDESALSYAASIGFAPVFVDGGLEAHEILDGTSGHGLSLNLRVGYRPQYLASTQFGIVAAWNEINVESGSIPEPDQPRNIDQASFGGFGDWHWNDLRLLASLVYFDNELDFATADVDDTYLLGYAQLEYEANDVVTVFGRIESGADQDDSTYLGLLENFVTERYMLGARWDVAQYHGLTFEIADTSYGASPGGSQDFNEYRLQWSAVFP